MGYIFSQGQGTRNKIMVVANHGENPILKFMTLLNTRTDIEAIVVARIFYVMS